jgi:2-dehydropantoate 2-reductase
MKTVVVGSGATGGFFGGLLAKAGVDVTFVARGRQLGAMRKELRVESADFGSFSLAKPNVTDDIRSIGGADLVLVCVKTYDLEAAASSLSPMLGPDTVVLPILNGVDARERLGAHVGPERVLLGSARIETTLAEPGLVRHTSAGVHTINFGEADGRVSDRSTRVRKTLEKGGFNVVENPNMREELWRKFSLMCAFGGLSAVSRLPNGPIQAHEPTKRLLEAAMREVVQTARAAGSPLSDDVVPTQMAFLAKRAWGFAPSMLRDLQAGRPIEVEALNGSAVRLAARHQVPAPVNDFLYACLKPFERGTPAPPQLRDSAGQT